MDSQRNELLLLCIPSAVILIEILYKILLVSGRGHFRSILGCHGDTQIKGSSIIVIAVQLVSDFHLLIRPGFDHLKSIFIPEDLSYGQRPQTVGIYLVFKFSLRLIFYGRRARLIIVTSGIPFSRKYFSVCFD